MEISSGASQPVTIEAQKKAQDVQSQQILKIIEGATEQSKQVTAQKTGLGNSLNISG
jgi:hypothetical protein